MKAPCETTAAQSNLSCPWKWHWLFLALSPPDEGLQYRVYLQNWYSIYETRRIQSYIPRILLGAMKGVLSDKSTESLELSPTKRHFEAIMQPWMQLWWYLLMCIFKWIHEGQCDNYHPQLAFFLFPVLWHWLCPDTMVLYRWTTACIFDVFDFSLRENVSIAILC